jgi:hypothetical protein
MIISGAALYYYNPQLNLEEFITPVLSNIEDKIPQDYPIIFVTGTFLYKFITLSIKYITRPKPNEDESKPNEDDNPNLLTPSARKDLEDFINNHKHKSRYSPKNDLNNDEKEDFENFFSEENTDTPKASSSKLPDIPENKMKIP